MKATVRSMCESDAAAFDYEYTLSGEVKSGETFKTLYARQRMKKVNVYVAEFDAYGRPERRSGFRGRSAARTGGWIP